MSITARIEHALVLALSLVRAHIISIGAPSAMSPNVASGAAPRRARAVAPPCACYVMSTGRESVRRVQCRTHVSARKMPWIAPQRTTADLVLVEVEPNEDNVQRPTDSKYSSTWPKFAHAKHVISGVVRAYHGRRRVCPHRRGGLRSFSMLSGARPTCSIRLPAASKREQKLRGRCGELVNRACRPGPVRRHHLQRCTEGERQHPGMKKMMRPLGEIC